MRTFNKKEYDLNYKKNNIKKFVVDLKKQEFEELELLLKNNHLTKAQFLRNSIQNLKK